LHCRDRAGQPVKNGVVILVPEFARRKNSFFYKRTTTNDQGTFSLRGLAPGDYQLFALSSALPDVEEDLDFFQQSTEKARPYELQPAVAPRWNWASFSSPLIR
jgi:hypothetical protein